MEDSSHNAKVVKQEPGAARKRKARGLEGRRAEAGVAGGSISAGDRQLEPGIGAEARDGLRAIFASAAEQTKGAIISERVGWE